MTVFTAAISYSHDSPEYKSKIRYIADQLRSSYGIEVYCDCYEEDMPYGQLMTSTMQNFISAYQKVLIFLSPQYKIKADEARGGVGYESMLIDAALYQQLGSAKFIPIIIDDIMPTDLAGYFPNFMPPTRKGIFRFDCTTNDEFIRTIAGAIANKPRNPKPPLGNSGWGSDYEINIDIDTVNIENLLEPKNRKLLYDNALYLSKKGKRNEFHKLSKQIKSHCIDKLLSKREQYERDALSNDKDFLYALVDDFIEIMSPVFLVCYAGYLSGNPDFTSQEGIMFDLLSIDTWNRRSGSTYVIIEAIPKMLVYVYHHIYGALHINRESPSKIFDILETKLPCDINHQSYDLLYRIRSVTGWIDSLGRDCFNSFRYLLDAYPRWNWIKMIFKDESEFKDNVTTYQLTIHLLNYFYSITSGIDNEMPYDIPPTFVIANDHKRYAQNWVIKNSRFFKEYLKNKNIPEEKVIEYWEQWRNGFHKYRQFSYYLNYLPENYIRNLLL